MNRLTWLHAATMTALTIMAIATPQLWAQDAGLSAEDLANFRQQVEGMAPAESGFELARIEDRQVSLGDHEVAVRFYEPAGEGPKPLLIYVHGACWIAGSLDSHDEVSRYLAQESGAMVVALDYRLAPEHPFPAANDDIMGVARWLWDNADGLGIDKSRFAISGESAGAHLATATVVRAIDEGDGPTFSFLLLVYAALDGGGASWTWCKDEFFASPEDVKTRYGSPLWVEDLSAMPPTFNVFGEFESSRAEQELFVHKLREDGVAVESTMNPGVGHDVGTWLSVSGDLTAHEAAVEYIRATFETSPMK